MSTSIEWTDATWNPVTGCQKISPGCKHCYAEGIAERFFAKQYPPNSDGSPRKFTDVRVHQERVMEPLHWKRPRMVFVNSMSDLFHEDVPFEFIDQIFSVMTFSKEHTFQILTKRPERMAEIVPKLWEKCTGGEPLDNVWLGVSVESQKHADERIPLLLNTPAAVRFISAEPLLEEIELVEDGPEVTFSWLRGFAGCDPPIPALHWVICGGESGPGARRFDIHWAESLLKQCKKADVPFFMKQLGSNAGYVTTSGEWATYTNDGNSRKGGDPYDWPIWLRVREFPKAKAVAA